MKYLILIFAVVLLSGCATELKVYDNTEEPAKGIPVPRPMLVKVKTTTTYTPISGATNPELCVNPTIKESYDYVSSAETYYVNVEPSDFAKGSFEINFNDKGLATKIHLNSEANTGADSIKGLVETVLPYYKSVAPAPAATADTASSRLAAKSEFSAEDLKAKNCLVKSEEIALSKISVTP